MHRSCTAHKHTGHPLKEVLKAWVRKWVRQASTLWREWRQKEGRGGPRSLVVQGYFISRNVGLYIFVKWSLSYYKEWNSISCNKMDSLIYTRSLKEVTERNPSRYPFPRPQSWELHAALLVPGIGTDKEQRILEKWHTKEEKCNIIGFLSVEHSLTITPFNFFIIRGDCRYFSEKGLDQMSLFSLNNFSWKAWYTANITTRIIISVIAPDPILCMPANLENSAVATGLEKVRFHSNPKERQCQRMLGLPHNCTHLTC